MREEFVDARTVANLELDRVMECLADRTASASGRAMALSLAPRADREAVEQRRGLAIEIGALLEPEDGIAGPRLPAGFGLSFLDDLEPLFSRLERSGVLEGEEVLRVVALIGPSLDLVGVVVRHGRRFPALRDLLDGQGLTGETGSRRLEEIHMEAAALLDEDGRLRDAASPELKQLRRRARDLRSRLSERARRLVDKYSSHLQDDFYTLRDDRYVLPVRSDARSGVRGIIHGSSNSGATLFVEPEVLVDDCNELKVIEGEAQAVEREILAELSAALSGQVGPLRRLHALLARVDLATAMARFARDVRGTWPRLSDEPVVELVGVRHTLLALAGGRVVPNDVQIRAGRGWILSGPNAGGKTVLIKTVGLAVLMAWTGLPVPAEPGSVVGTFDHVRAEIGDAQSVEDNLSTFSAQVAALASILGAAGPRSLLLLDELAAGTDPDEGAALAEALVTEMIDRGAAVLIATHFEPLKKLSISDDALVAAGMGLDLELLEPTFELHVGMPGTSGGLLVAERFGLPPSVVGRARTILEQGRGSEEGRLHVLERLHGDLEGRLRQVDELEEKLKSREVRLEERERGLLDEQRRRMQTEERYLATELTVLRSELKHAHKVLRRRPVRERDVHGSEKLASRVGRAIAPDGPVSLLVRPERKTEPLGEVALAAGDIVYVPRLDLEGEVESVSEGRVRIRKGSIAWTVELADVVKPAEEPGQPAGERAMQENKNPPAGEEEDESVQTSYNTIDLRGHGLDEAQIDLDAFLDEAREMGIEEVFVIHGHGKGVLKTGLRRYLRHLKKVESFRPGKRGEGGDGVTVCKLKGE